MRSTRPHPSGLARTILTFLVILGGAAPDLVAQTWWQERERIRNETAAILDQLRSDPNASIASYLDDIRRLSTEYLRKVTKPQLEAASSCDERIAAIEDTLAFLQQLEAWGMTIPGAAELYAEVTAGAYANQSYDRCMNEMYRRCVLEDDARYAKTMATWASGWQRMKQLFGSRSGGPLLNEELDPRITKCRGAWYKVRITVERKGEDDIGPWYQRDVSTGWLGRGLSHEVSGREDGKHPAGFERRAEALGYGAVCPDGGCGETCSFVHVMSGPARVTYELESRFVDDFRELSVGFVEGRMTERFERNTCGHTDVPDPHYPGNGYHARLHGTFPPLEVPDEESDADPAVTEQLDEWPRLFGRGGTELLIWDEPIGRLEVLAVCDGQEIWGKGSSECREKWNEYLVYFGEEIPGVLGPEAPGSDPSRK